MRTLGLDYGSKTVGVAVTDPLGLTAQGVEIIRRQKENHLRKTYQRIKELCEQYDVEKIVLGLPLNMDDTMGDRAEKTLEFKKELERRLSVPVLLVDERLTTVEAIEIMDDAGIKVSEREKYVDMIAATIILQDYMNSHEGHMDTNKIILIDDEGNEEEFYIEEQTRVYGKNYILVSTAQEGDAEALILKDISEDSNEEAAYVPVDDESELAAVMKIFEEMLDDIDIQ